MLFVYQNKVYQIPQQMIESWSHASPELRSLRERIQNVTEQEKADIDRETNLKVMHQEYTPMDMTSVEHLKTIEFMVNLPERDNYKCAIFDWFHNTFSNLMNTFGSEEFDQFYLIGSFDEPETYVRENLLDQDDDHMGYNLDTKKYINCAQCMEFTMKELERLKNPTTADSLSNTLNQMFNQPKEQTPEDILRKETESSDEIVFY